MSGGGISRVGFSSKSTIGSEGYTLSDAYSYRNHAKLYRRLRDMGIDASQAGNIILAMLDAGTIPPMAKEWTFDGVPYTSL